MQLTVGEIMGKVHSIDHIRDLLENRNTPLDDYRDEIDNLLDEYREVLLNAKVKV